MKPYIYNIILGLLTLLVLILPFIGKVHDGRHKGWLKGFTKRGWIVCIAFIATIIVNILKDLQNDRSELAKEATAKIQKKKDDSAFQKRSDATAATIVHSVTIALAQYGLKYDSDEKVIQKIVRDSSRRTINKAQPNLVLSSIIIKTIENNLYHFNLTILSQNAVSEHINVKQYIAVEEQSDTYLLNGPGDFFARDGGLDANQSFSYNVDLTCIKPKVFYFLILGSYKNDDGKKFKIGRIYSYDMSLNAFGYPLEPSYSKIKTFFKNHNIEF
jgi:hypothetical protein